MFSTNSNLGGSNGAIMTTLYNDNIIAITQDKHKVNPLVVLRS